MGGMQSVTDAPVFSVRRLAARQGAGEVSADLVVLFGVSGSAELQLEGSSVPFKPDDVLCVNQGIPLEVARTQDAAVAEARFSPRTLARFLPEDNPFFFCNSAAVPDILYGELRTIFYELMYQYLYRRHGTDCHTESLLLSLLDCLIEHFRVDKSSGAYQESDDERLRALIIAVNTSFQYDVSLHSLAKKLHTSASTLSRLFKKKTGLYFADYVASVRAKHALSALLTSEASLTQIALDSGFANSSVFTAVFKRLYGMSPSAFRESHAPATAQPPDDGALRENLLRSGLFSGGEGEAGFLSLTIPADAPARPYPRFWGTAINIGPLYALTMADMQAHVLKLQDQLRFSVVRLWNIFSTRLMVGGSGGTGFNFDKINLVLDFLEEHRLRPFLELGSHPDMARTADNTIFYQEERMVFTSRAEWEGLMRAFMRNVTERYGVKEVSRWLFDISRDGGHSGETPYWSADGYRFFDAWRVTRSVIKEWCPEAAVGGICGVVSEDADFLAGFWADCRADGCLPDFTSFDLFPYAVRTADGRLERSQTPDCELGQVEVMHRLREQSGLDGLPLYITGWNNSISNRNILNDSCYRGAYIVHTVLALWGKVDMLALLMGSDLVSSYADSIGVVNGGIGLLTKNAIRKPAWFAFQFLSQLPGSLVQKGRQFVVAQKPDGGCYLLLCNYKHLSRRYYMQSEDVELHREMATLNENNLPLRVHVALTRTGGAPGERWCIKKRTVSSAAGSIVDEWRKLGFTTRLTVQDIDYLAAMCTPALSLETASAANGVLEFEVSLDPQEIALLHVYRPQ